MKQTPRFGSISESSSNIDTISGFPSLHASNKIDSFFRNQLIFEYFKFF